MKKKVIVAIALMFVCLSLCAMIPAEESDADNPINLQAYVTQDGIKFDLCYQPDASTYGSEYIAFVTGGSVLEINTNVNYSQPVLEIPAYVEFEGISYPVVGIRNNAFQASLTTERFTANIQKVILPETMVSIGVGKDYIFSDSNAHCFSGCTGLKEIVVKGSSPQLKNIAVGAFKNVSLDILDLSNCVNLERISPHAFENIGLLKLVDIRSAMSVGQNAFIDCTNIQQIIMPQNPAASINNRAFDEDLTFVDKDGNVVIGDQLVGKAFKFDGSVMKEGFIATFDPTGGTVIREGVYFVGETLDVPTKSGVSFYTWRYSGGDTLVMPGAHTDFTAIWQVDKPASAELTYNATEQDAYTDTSAYTVANAKGKNVGNYTATFTLKPYTVWSDSHVSTPADVPWKILPKDVTVSGIIASDKIYDATTDATVNSTGATFNGILNGDVLTVTATGAFDSKDVGDRNVILSNLVLGGASASNYKLADSGQQVSAPAKILHKDVYVTANAATKVYGDADPSLSATEVGVLDGFLTYSVTRAEG